MIPGMGAAIGGFEQAAGGGGPTYPLDGLSPTGAWSMSRDLLTSFAGGTKYTTATGVDSWKDQTGNSRHFENVTGTVQPAVSTAGPNSRACLDFDGVDDYLQNAVTNASLFANNAALIIVSCLVDTISTDSSDPTSDVGIFGDTGGYTGLSLRSTGPAALAYNFDGNYDIASTGIATTVPLVLIFRHEGGTLYVSSNGGAEASVASGNTGDLAYNTRLGRKNSAFLDGKVFEMASFSTVPSAPARATLIADLMNHIGAV